MRPSGPCIVDAEMIDDQGATLSLDMSQSILRRSPRLLGDRVNSSPHSPRLDNTPPEIFQDYDGPLFKTTPKVQSFMTLVTPQSLGSNLLAALEDSRPNGAAPMAGTSSVASNPLLQKAEESLTASSNGKESSTASSNGADLAATSGTTSKRLHQSKHSMTRSSTRGGAGGGSGAANAGGAAVVPAGEGDEVEQNKNKLTSKAPSTVTEDGALLSERLVSDSRATGTEEGGAGHRKVSRTEREKHSSRGGVSRKIDNARLHQSKHSVPRSSTRGGAGGGSGAANAGGAAVVPAGEGDEVEQNKNKLTSKAPSTMTEDGALLSERLVSDSRATGAEEGGAGHRKMSRTERRSTVREEE